MSSDHTDLFKAHFADLFGFFRKFVEHDTSHMTLLDFGCGHTGYVSLYGEHFGRSLGLDVVDYAHKYDENIEFVVSNGRDIPLPDRSVDVIVSHSALEHVEDVEFTISEMSRVLIEGGYAYLTVSPLYFSQGGGHIRTGPEARRLANWEHLDPESPYHLGSDQAPVRVNRRDWLNKLTTERFLAAVGQQPWDILAYRIKAEHDKLLPPFLRAGDINRVDLYTKEFRIVARKSFSVVDDKIISASARVAS